MTGHLSLKWNNHASAFLKSISTIQDKERYCDATIACQGKYFPVHRIVLSTCSDYFEEMFERMQCQHPYIVFKDIEPREMEMLLNYMYKGEVNVVQEMLPTLIKAAEALRIKGLAVPDDASPGKKRSSSNMDNSQQKRKSEEVKRRRRNSSGSEIQMATTSEKTNAESFLSQLAVSSPSERFSDTSSVGPGLQQSEQNIIKEEPLDSCDYDNGTLPTTDSQAAVGKEESVYVNFPITSDGGSYIKMEDSATSEQPYETQESSWSEFGGASAVPSLPHIEMNSQDSIHKVEEGLETEMNSHSETGPSTSFTVTTEQQQLLEIPKVDEELETEMKTHSETETSTFTVTTEHHAVEVYRVDSLYLCPFCRYKSKSKWDVKRHFISKHTRIREFSCSYCPLQFARKQHLEGHIRMHTGEKPFQCPQCLRRFTHQNSLKYHHKRNHVMSSE